MNREDHGEGRDLKVVLVGVDVSDDLVRMVTYLSSSYGVPIRVCTLSASAAPDGGGLILLRDVSEDPEISPAEAPMQASTYQERFDSVRSHFAAHGWSAVFGAVVDVFADSPNVYLRPWKRALMIAPARNHTRYLAYLTPRKDGVFASYGVEPLQEFFPQLNLSRLRGLVSPTILSQDESARAWAQAVSDALA